METANKTKPTLHVVRGSTPSAPTPPVPPVADGAGGDDAETAANEIPLTDGHTQEASAIAATSPESAEGSPAAQHDDPDEDVADDDPEGERGREKLSRRLVRLFDDAYLWHSPDGKAFATVAVGEHEESYAIEDRQFGQPVLYRAYRQLDEVPSPNALSEAVALLNARARFEGDIRKAHVRVADAHDRIILDLGDKEWRVVEVDADGWRTTPGHRTGLYRPGNVLALPEPVRGGAIHVLRRFLNLRHDDDFMMLVGWMVAALRPGYPFAILRLEGEQGSSKSTVTEIIKKLVDHTSPVLCHLPNSTMNLLIAARASWVLAFENLSTIKPEISDTLCTIATGGGGGTRKLWNDSDETTFNVMRPIIMNGIEVPTRRDLNDRSIVLSLPPIQNHERVTMRPFWREFDAVKGEIFGALLDGVATGLARLDEIEESTRTLPRMADFAAFAAASAPAFGWDPDDMLAALERNRFDTTTDGVLDDPVGAAIKEMMTTRDRYEGSATDLLNDLAAHVPEALRVVRGEAAWPKAPNSLSARLARMAPSLRALGIDVRTDGSNGRRGTEKRRQIVISKLET